MKIRTTFIGAALCAMVAACSSAPDTTERAEAIQKKADELGKFVTPLYIQIEPFTCIGVGDMSLDSNRKQSGKRNKSEERRNKKRPSAASSCSRNERCSV